MDGDALGYPERIVVRLPGAGEGWLATALPNEEYWDEIIAVREA